MTVKHLAHAAHRGILRGQLSLRRAATAHDVVGDHQRARSDQGQHGDEVLRHRGLVRVDEDEDERLRTGSDLVLQRVQRRQCRSDAHLDLVGHAGGGEGRACGLGVVVVDLQRHQ